MFINFPDHLRLFCLPTGQEWKLKRDSPVPVNVSQYDPSSSLTQRYKYMFQKLVDKATALNDMIDDIGMKFLKAYFLRWPGLALILENFIHLRNFEILPESLEFFVIQEKADQQF